MRRARTELNLTERVALAMVCEGPTHGWRIVRALRPGGEIGAVWVSSAPLVYRAIRRLQDDGFVTATPTEGEHGPDRAVLTALQSGSAQNDAWLAKPVAHIRDLRTELLLKLLLLERRGLDARDLVQRQREQWLPIVEALRAKAVGTDVGVVDRWRAANGETAIGFLDSILRSPGSVPPRTPATRRRPSAAR